MQIRTGARNFVIRDGPDAMKVAGLSFTVSPETPQQEIAAWTSLGALPDELTVWKWYAQREVVAFTEEENQVHDYCYMITEFQKRGADWKANLPKTV